MNGEAHRSCELRGLVEGEVPLELEPVPVYKIASPNAAWICNLQSSVRKVRRGNF